MTDARISTLLRRVARLASRPGAATGDAVLLDRFTRGGDPTAFAELVTRHGPAVWGLCRRLLRTEADAEDVFQATFLVLARDAGRVRKAASVGSWLYGVAFRLGRKARARRGRPLPDPTGIAPPAAPPDPASAVTWDEVRAALDEELARLPDDLRAPLLLCYFDGLTQDEAAASLGWKLRTLKARVARGREVLRTRLTRRGIELPAVLAAPMLSAGFASAVPPNLAAAALAAARGYPPGPDVPPAVLALAQTEVSAMSAARLAVAVCVAVLIAGGVALGLRAWLAGHPQPTRPSADAPQPGGAVPIGTTQFRHVGWHSGAYFTDDGNTLLVVGEGVTVRWWDVETGKQRHELAFKGYYQSAAFAPVADLLAVVGNHSPDGDDGKSESVLWLIDAAGRKVLRTVGLPGNLGGNSQKVRISDDGRRVFVEYEGDVRVIDGKTGDELIRHKGRINAGVLAASRDGKLVAFGRYDVWLWRWETGEEPKKFAAVGGFGTELVKFAPDGKSLYIVPYGGMVTTWDVATGRQSGSRRLRASPGDLAFSPDGKTLACVYLSNYLRPPEGGHAIDLLDAEKWNEVGRVPLGRTGVGHVSWSKDGSRLAGVSSYRAWAWDAKTGKVLGPTRPGHEGVIGALAFGPDGTLFTASDDHTIRSWDAATLRPGLALAHDHWVRDVDVSPDGLLVAGSSLRNDLRVWDAKTGKPRFRLLGNGMLGGKRRVRFTTDGKHLIAWGDDEFVRVWDVRNGKLLAEHTTHPAGEKVDEDDPFGERGRHLKGMMDAADISPDGSVLALIAGKGVRVLDPMTGKERQTLTAGDDRPHALALSPDGKRMALAFHGKPVQSKLPDGRVRHTTEKEYPVSVWDLAAGKKVWTATAEGSSPALAYSPDGSRVAVVSSVWRGPSRVWVWDAETGKEAGRIELPRRGIHVVFDRTGKHLAVSLDDTTALVYDLEATLKAAK